MRKVLLLLAVLLLVLGLWFGAERMGWLGDTPDEARQTHDGDLLSADGVPGEDGDAAAGLIGRGKRTSVGTAEAQSVLPEPVDLEAAAKRGDLHGIVVRRDGVPLSGVLLQLVRFPWRRGSGLAAGRWDEEHPGAETLSALDGTFALPLQAGRPTWLRATCEGYASVDRANCRAGERVRFVLLPGVGLRVIAQDPKGTRLGGVDLILRGQEDETQTGLRRTGKTDLATGEFLFENLPPGLAYTLEANHGHLGGWTWREDVPALPPTGEGLATITIKPGRIVRGVVTDAATGRPIVGARVGMGWTIHKETRTDDEGRYALGGWTGNGYREIHVLADGYARAQQDVGTAAHVDLKLVPGFSVRGRIVDPQGAPVTGAQVGVVGSTHDEEQGHRISTAHGATDAEGRFLLPGLQPELAHVLIVTGEGWGRYLTEFNAPPSPRRLVDLGDIALPPGVTLSGRVLDAEGTGVADAAITIVGANDDARRLRPGGTKVLDEHYGRMEEVVADAEGRFACADLSPGTYTVRAGGNGDFVTTRVKLGPEESPAPITLRLRASQTFTVWVRDEEGQGLKGVFVNVEPEGAQDFYQSTDAEGRVTVRLPLHVRWVSVDVLDTSDVAGAAYLTQQAQRVAVSGEPFEVVLKRAALVRGLLLDPEGNPVFRAWIQALRGAEPIGGGSTDVDGAFQILVPPGGRVELLFRGDVWRNPTGGRVRRMRLALEARLAGVEPGPKSVSLRAISIPRAASLRALVTDADGSPIPGAVVELTPTSIAQPMKATTDEAGLVSFGGLSAHPVTLMVLPPEGREGSLAALARKDIQPEGQTITLALRPPLLFVGTVVDEDGRPVAGAGVQVRGGFAGGWARTTSDGEGQFRLALPPDIEGLLSVWATKPDSDGVLHLADVSGVDPRKGSLQLVLRPYAGR